MGTALRGVSKLQLVSIMDNSLAFGHKSALDSAGLIYNGMSFTTASTCRDISQVSDVPGTKIFLSTLLDDLNKKGLIIKG